MGTVIDVTGPTRERSKPRFVEREADEARVSDYVIFFGVAAISLSLIVLGVVKLLDIF